MVTIHRSDGFRVIIYTNDHAPAHVHVIKGKKKQPGGGEVKINLVASNGNPSLIWARGDLSKSDLRKAMDIVAQHQDKFIVEWKRIHG